MSIYSSCQFGGLKSPSICVMMKSMDKLTLEEFREFYVTIDEVIEMDKGTRMIFYNRKDDLSTVTQRDFTALKSTMAKYKDRWSDIRCENVNYSSMGENRFRTGSITLSIGELKFTSEFRAVEMEDSSLKMFQVGNLIQQ